MVAKPRPRFSASTKSTVHADKHAMEWQNNNTLFQGNDGGIYKTTNGGTTWTDNSNGLVISQLYKLGVSQTNNAVIGGLQDNGTKLRNNAGSWTDEIGGDGMECAIDQSNASYMYGELYYGDIEKSTNAVGIFADDDDLFDTDLEQEVIAFVRDPRHMPGQQPLLTDDAVHICFEYRITGVKFLIKAVANARVCGEAGHHVGLRFGHQIFIRALLGSNIGLSEAVTG